MFTVLKIVQSLVRALNSDGTPHQVAAGMALGACLGLTPLFNLHNLVMVAVIALLNVSVPGAILGWLLTIPLGFLLDPVFDAAGRALLEDSSGLTALWTTIYNTPLLSFANLNNSVVLGSLIGWAVLALPIYGLARYGVARYRKTIYVRIAKWRVFQVVRASKLYNLYRLFQP